MSPAFMLLILRNPPNHRILQRINFTRGKNLVGSSSGWFVVLGSILSIISAAVTTWFTQRSTSERERMAREHDRRIKLIDFQIKALIDTQDALTELNAAAVDPARHVEAIDSEVARKGTERVAFAYDAVRKVQVRINDVAARDLVDSYVCLAAGYTPDPLDEIKGPAMVGGRRVKLNSALHSAHQRIGELIRELHGAT